MRVYIVGLKGNMGSRYKAILEYLKHDVYGHDLEFANTSIMERCDAFIVATPTVTHTVEVIKLLKFNKPILVEKPITKNEAALEAFISVVEDRKHLITIVNQYAHHVDYNPNSSGPTYYSYFKSGADGLKWDCVSLFMLAKEGVRLNNKSPYWSCCINGDEFNIDGMDFAYMKMIDSWLKEPKSNFDESVEAHRKVFQWSPS